MPLGSADSGILWPRKRLGHYRQTGRLVDLQAAMVCLKAQAALLRGVVVASAETRAPLIDLVAGIGAWSSLVGPIQ